MKIVILASTSGSVMNALLQVSYFRQRVHHVVADRLCGAVRVAERAGLTTSVLASDSGAEFSDKVVDYLDLSSVDLVILFYTRILSGRLVEMSGAKMINLHPSILPACPGMDGFGDTVRSGSRFIGSTIHFVEAQADAGPQIIQSAAPYDPGRSLAENRHEVFVDQCRCLLQVVKWWEDGRILLAGRRVTIVGARFDRQRYAPGLDFDLAANFNIAHAAGTGKQ